MSLALLQGYSSAEEEEGDDPIHYANSSEDDRDGERPRRPLNAGSALFDVPKPSSNSSGLPSAFDVFSEIVGPPEFLNNSVEEQPSAKEIEQQRHGSRRRSRDKKDMPVGAVLESKPQLVGIHERVRSDIEGSQPPTASVSTMVKDGKRVATATNPNAEDAAELLRMCLQCGIPKTYSSARGMVCPVCGDRPPTDPDKEPKKKGSVIKDKEKSKRLKGQSSHATWKSETEMQLRQQFD
ncbi:hypothetical protein BT93_A2203 [Corymbia citriodora subsp. variegata]|nr:hypothetical protein BT93_A2203 [Corymbia citriodora subsp. variegata]